MEKQNPRRYPVSFIVIGTTIVGLAVCIWVGMLFVIFTGKTPLPFISSMPLITLVLGIVLLVGYPDELDDLWESLQNGGRGKRDY